MNNPRSSIRTSVLINNYNNGRFLDHCLASVINQEPKPDEIIVYDDGSTDDSLEILSRYASRIRLIARPHGTGSPLQNQADAIDTAFRASSGNLIFLLDGDDAFLPGKIAAYTEALAQTPSAVMIQAPLEKIDHTGRRLGIEFEAARHQSNYLEHIYKENELNIYYPTSALAFSREYLSQHLPIDFSDGRRLWPDARLALIAPHFGSVVALSRPYSQWRRHPGSHTVAKQLSIYELVRMNQDYFNGFCRATGRKPISPWRSRHHRRRWFRHYFVPYGLVQWFRAVRWATLSKEHQQRMLSGPDLQEMARELDKMKQRGLEVGAE